MARTPCGRTIWARAEAVVGALERAADQQNDITGYAVAEWLRTLIAQPDGAQEDTPIEVVIELEADTPESPAFRRDVDRYLETFYAHSPIEYAGEQWTVQAMSVSGRYAQITLRRVEGAL